MCSRNKISNLLNLNKIFAIKPKRNFCKKIKMEKGDGKYDGVFYQIVQTGGVRAIFY